MWQIFKACRSTKCFMFLGLKRTGYEYGHLVKASGCFSADGEPIHSKGRTNCDSKEIELKVIGKSNI